MSADHVVPGFVPDPIKEANTAANLANAVTAIYGISGSGKSSDADTAAEYTWETFKKITLCYVADLGGFGTKRLSLIRAGIMRVWDPRNHVDGFSTMELMSLGAFPETLVDPETGYAAPDVRLILPRRVVYTMLCPQGHVADRQDKQAVFAARTINCPTCGVPTNLSNAQRVEKSLVRHKMFRDVGLRIYDSFTALNDWGMDDLQRQSAEGKLPVNSSGGSALGGADALYSGEFKFSSGSKAQYGFLQNRTYGWLANIKTIPDQVVPAICTFLVESTAGGDETGGEAVYGPKIAGSARTANVASWVGNLLHASKEPNADGVMVYRLWLTNHYDPRDPRRMPYLAKHRGTPLGMPDYLEDVPGSAPWSGCSLKVFFEKLNAQLLQLDAERAARYPDAPGVWSGEMEDNVDEVISSVVPTSGGTAAPSATTATPTVRSGRGLRRAATPVSNIISPSGSPLLAHVISKIDTAPSAQLVAGAAPEPVVDVSPATAAAMTAPATRAQETATTAADPSPVAQEPHGMAHPAAPPSPPSTPQPSVSTAVTGSVVRRRLARPPVG